jgi:hypothetical protein
VPRYLFFGSKIRQAALDMSLPFEGRVSVEGARFDGGGVKARQMRKARRGGRQRSSRDGAQNSGVVVAAWSCFRVVRGGLQQVAA